jgi:hypothetical protein
MPGKVADGLGDAEAVFQQPVTVGLMVELGRRRQAVALPQFAVLAEQSIEEGADVRVLDRRDQLTQRRLHLRDLARRTRHQIVRVEAAELRRA